MSNTPRRPSPEPAFDVHHATNAPAMSSFPTRIPVETPLLPIPWTPLAGFEPHRLLTIDGEEQFVYRNWRRKAKPNFRRHVLILDKDPQLLRILGQLLDDGGYNVTLSTCQLSAGTITRLRPDVILADTQFDLHSAEKSLFSHALVSRQDHTIPIIYSTLMPGTARKLGECNVSILLKPFDLDDFLELIAHVTS